MLARMKGIAHFASGLCAATFVPGVVEASADGALWIALAGVSAMLPDFLDFRFARFLQRRDAEIIAPCESGVAPQAAAQQIARELAVQFDAAVASGRQRVIQLHPRRLGVIDWATWTVRFSGDDGRGCVQLRECTAFFDASRIDYGYDGALEAGELGGPALLLAPDGSGRVRIEFLPWHRTWSHSLVLALAWGAILALAFGVIGGIVGVLGFAVHVLEDQLGYMGSNLLWPLRPARAEERTRGLELLHSGDAIPNFVTVWLSLTLMLFNLDRAMPVPLLEPLPYLLGAVVLPSATLLLRYALRRIEATRALGAQREALAEAEAG